MSRKHFIDFAKMIAEFSFVFGKYEYVQLKIEMIRILKSHNANFNESRFNDFIEKQILIESKRKVITCSNGNAVICLPPPSNTTAS